MKNNKKQNLFKYIKDTTGLSVSKMLLSFIIEPNRMTTLNNAALKKINSILRIDCLVTIPYSNSLLKTVT